MSIAGLILAGGASRRMGAPKPLLKLDGETFLDRLISVFRPCCDPVMVVLGFDADRIRAGLRRASEARFVVNPEPERGQLSSMQCGLREMPPEVEAAVFTPVDYPRVRPATVRRLVEAFQQQRGTCVVVVPTCEGLRGHPVCIAREIFPEFLALPAESQARDVIHRYAGRTRYVEVGDSGILRDVDDPQAYRELQGPDAQS